MTNLRGNDGNPSNPSTDEKKMRSFAEIIAEEKANRNILVIKLTKMTDATGAKAPNLSMEDVGELMFDKMKLIAADCKSVALYTSRYDTKEVLLKPGVDPSPYITTAPFEFKGHEVSVSRQLSCVTRVMFRNVPYNIPDEELIHLCKFYGKPVRNEVMYEQPTKASRGVPGSNIIVMVEMEPGKQFENYYWMEGPLPGDQGCRITVLHNGQISQCGNCLKRGMNCPGGGQQKVCITLNTPRGEMAKYMEYLKKSIGYTSLKMEFMKNFPTPEGADFSFGHIVDPVNPEEEEKDEKIEFLQQQVSDYNDAILRAVNVEKEKFEKISEEMKIVKRQAARANNKLQHVRKVTEQRFLNSLPNDDFMENDCDHLVAIYATVSEDDIFDYNEEDDSIKWKDEEKFMSEVANDLGSVQSDTAVKFKLMKNKVLEKVKTSEKERRSRRRRSIGSASHQTDWWTNDGRSTSRTRPRSDEEKFENPAKSRRQMSTQPDNISLSLQELT